MDRLDKILIIRGFFTSRTKAEDAILKGSVHVNGVIIEKPSKKINPDSEITISVTEEFVSRGSYKLIHAIDNFRLTFKDKIVIDLGASTGGFTQVLLKTNCKKIYCVDVGKDQLHPSIKINSKIINLEKTHIKDLNSDLIPELVDAFVIDLSFISLTKILHFLPPFLKSNGFVVALIKPQFEVGKINLSKKGIVKNTRLYPQVIEEIKSVAIKNNLSWIDYCDSPILGGDGNKEFLCYLRKSSGMNV